MSILNDVIRLDKEYRALLHTTELAFAAVKPLGIAASGLCDGAADAAYVSLLADLNRRREEGARGMVLDLLDPPSTIISTLPTLM